MTTIATIIVIKIIIKHTKTATSIIF
jgi:hypothetical protein